MYKNLPEVKQKNEEQRRAEFYQTNRLRAKLYGKVGPSKIVLKASREISVYPYFVFPPRQNAFPDVS